MPRVGFGRMTPTFHKGVARRVLTAAALLGCLAYLGGCGGSLSGNISQGSFAPTQAADAAAKLTSAATPGNSGYKIGPLDSLDVQVFKVPDLSKNVQVADDGTITYPLIGVMTVAGKTTRELEAELAQKLGGKYIRNPHVTVLVKEYNSQRVTVEGGVKTTGVYALKGRTTLTQILAMAGDVDSSISSGDIVIFRTIEGKRSAAKFDFDDIRSGKIQDPELNPGDVIVADTSATKVALANVLKVLPLATSAAVFVPLM
jgi:polysaccharide export outer membrane protein